MNARRGLDSFVVSQFGFTRNTAVDGSFFQHGRYVLATGFFSLLGQHFGGGSSHTFAGFYTFFAQSITTAQAVNLVFNRV